MTGRFKFPVRPSPRPPESVAGYVNRVAQLNHVEPREVMGRSRIERFQWQLGFIPLNGPRTVDLPGTFNALTCGGRYGTRVKDPRLLRTKDLRARLHCGVCGNADNFEPSFTFVVCCVHCGGLLTPDDNPTRLAPEVVVQAQRQLLTMLGGHDPIYTVAEINGRLAEMAWAVSPAWPPPVVPGRQHAFQSPQQDLRSYDPRDIARMLPWLARWLQAEGDLKQSLSIEIQLRSLFRPFHPIPAPTIWEDLPPATWHQIVKEARESTLQPEFVPLIATVNQTPVLESLTLVDSRVALSWLLCEAASHELTRGDMLRLHDVPTFRGSSGPRLHALKRVLRGTPYGRRILILALRSLASAGFTNRPAARKALRGISVPAHVLRQIPGLSNTPGTADLAKKWVWAYATSGTSWDASYAADTLRVAEFDRRLTPEGRLILADYAHQLLDPERDLDFSTLEQAHSASTEAE